VLAEKFIGVFIQSPLPGTIRVSKIVRCRQCLANCSVVGEPLTIVCTDVVNDLPEWSQQIDRGQGDICGTLTVLPARTR
jgi:hypothetical protein